MSYRLETSRHRPPPLSFTPSGDKPSLLYDLPSVTSPLSPKANAASPTSPTSGRRRASNRLRSPPQTPSRALQSDLEFFAEQCRSWYYNQDDEAGRLMTQTLTTLPPSQRAPFAKLQASIRSAYHASVSARRNAEFHAHLNSTAPGGSLTAHSRMDPSNCAASKERYERFEAFVRTWCTIGMPGARPFFEGLWAVMRLQAIPRNLGGAGERRIVWQIDDAVFKESAGKEFMLEAIDVLKGVLAFEEVADAPSRLSSMSVSQATSSTHARAKSQPLSQISAQSRISSKPSLISTTTSSKRSRALSDPFLDIQTPPLSQSLATVSSSTSGNRASDIADCDPISGPHSDDEVFFQNGASRQDPFCEADTQLRTWTTPDLRNAEYTTLYRTFPLFVSERPLPRFPLPRSSERKRDIEEGEAELDEMSTLHFGTGTITLSGQERSPGWEDNWWTLFVMWWRTIFC